MKKKEEENVSKNKMKIDIKKNCIQKSRKIVQ